MRRIRIVLTIAFILVNSMSLSTVNGAPEENLALTLYGNGLVNVNYFIETDQMDIQVVAQLFGTDIQNLVVRDENGDPLDSQLTDSTIIVDSIGASELRFSYYTESLVKTESGLTIVSINSPVPVSIILPTDAEFFDMSHIPTQISEIDGVTTLRFESGDIFVYYLIGLPKLNQESAVSIEKAETYILSKQSEGYRLVGATDLLSQATSEFSNREYYYSKNLADDALKVAVITVESAENALQSINSVKASLDFAQNGDSSKNLVQALEQLTLAQEQYEQGAYVRASLTALDIAKLDLSSSPNIFSTVFKQSIPLLLILGICSGIYFSKNVEKIPFNYLLRGGINE